MKYKFYVIWFHLCEPLKNSKNHWCRKFGWDSLRPIIKTLPIAADSAFLFPMNTYRPHLFFDLFQVFVSAAYLETLSSWEPIGHTRLEIRSVSHSANITDFLMWKMRIRKEDLGTLCLKCDVSINPLPVGFREIFRRGGRKITRAKGHEIYIARK